ncbi:MAG: AmmeMemoRadiSam system protein B [Spirochaetota bacterium]
MIGDFLKSVEPIPAEGEKEHSIEVQLPFLQVVVKDFSIVPVLIGDLSWDGD